MYYLDGKEIKKADMSNLDFWKIENRRIGLDTVGPFEVSTVFLPSNHGTKDKPKFFETLIFVNSDISELNLSGDMVKELATNGDTITARYATYDEAVEGHNNTVYQLRIEIGNESDLSSALNPHC